MELTPTSNKLKPGEIPELTQDAGYWAQQPRHRDCAELNRQTMKAFTPINLNGKLKVKNRYVMAPMGTVGLADMDGIYTQRGVDYYVERAKGGVGLITTGIQMVNCNVEQFVPGMLPTPALKPHRYIMANKEMTEKVHSYGSKIIGQLAGGMGRCLIPDMGKKFIAPSTQPNRFNKDVMCIEMTLDEIQELVASFGSCAKTMKMAGYDGVEVHAVHEGYLLDQFAISMYNKRTDQYGGSLENRLRIVKEIAEAIRESCGEEFYMSIRYSVKSFNKDVGQGALPGEKFEEAGRDWEEGLTVAQMLVDYGFDALSVDAGTYDSWYWNHPPTYFGTGMYVPFCDYLKTNGIKVPIVCAGRMEDPRLTESALGEEKCDMVALGRALLADPFVVNKIGRGEFDRVRPCVGCHDGCMGRMADLGTISCALNPATGREREYTLTPAFPQKKILVVGGGPGGLEFALTAAQRGHSVTLIEKREHLGGSLFIAGQPSFKHDDLNLVEWYELEMEKAGVNVLMGIDFLSVAPAYKDSVIVMATGGTPIVPKPFAVPGVQLAEELLLGHLKENKDLLSKYQKEGVVVLGGGLVGCETALYLCRDVGIEKVSVIEKMPMVLRGGAGAPHMNYWMMLDLMDFHGVKKYENHTVIEVEATRVKVEAPPAPSAEGSVENAGSAQGQEFWIEGNVINALGYRPNAIEIPFIPREQYSIGDCNGVANIMKAIWDARQVAMHV